MSNYDDGYFRRVLGDIEAYAIFTLDSVGVEVAGVALVVAELPSR